MKIRLYAQPPGRASMLIEVDLPEGSGTDLVKLKCFSPPPNDQAEIAQYGDLGAALSNPRIRVVGYIHQGADPKNTADPQDQPNVGGAGFPLVQPGR